MLRCGWPGSISTRRSSMMARFLFQPVQFHLELTDLLIKASLLALRQEPRLLFPEGPQPRCYKVPQDFIDYNGVIAGRLR